jgi:hypothetical protein
MWISEAACCLGALPGEKNGRPRVYNTQVLVDNNGNLAKLLQKSPPFDVSIPGKVSLQSASTAAGGELVLKVI